MATSLGIHQITHSVGDHLSRHPLLGSGEALAVAGIIMLSVLILSNALTKTDLPVAEPAPVTIEEPEASATVPWPWKKRVSRYSTLYASPPRD